MKWCSTKSAGTSWESPSSSPYLIVDFGDKLIDLLADSKAVEPELIITVIVGLIGTGIGGLIIAMGRMFDSPSVPADTHERMLKDARREE